MTDQQGYKSITGLVDRAPSPIAPLAAPQSGGIQLCNSCNTVIVGPPYSVNSKMMCKGCAVKAHATDAGLAADSHTAYVHGILLGVGAAIAGLVLYATFTIVTHLYLGYIALAVGWMVGKAIITGSNGAGGPRYQIAAGVLTYAAISLASIPIGIAGLLSRQAGTNVDWAAAAPRLLMLGIASPFLDLQTGFSGIIGLVILFVGLRIAIRLTAAKTQRTVSVPPPTARPSLGL